jgi:hypothetical protein
MSLSDQPGDVIMADASFYLTAEQITSHTLLAPANGRWTSNRYDLDSHRYVSLMFKTMIDAASYVDVTDIAAYVTIKTHVVRMTQNTVIEFAYTDYQRDGDAINGYTIASPQSRSDVYIRAIIHRKYVETHPDENK